VTCELTQQTSLGPRLRLADCDDENIYVHPGIAETCDDLVDNNCDGLTDLADPRCLR